MKNLVVIKPSSLPPKLPLQLVAVIWLLLDRFDAPGWAFGVMWTLVVILFIVVFARLHRAQFKDVPGFGEE
jgi:hypothetical protein